MLPALRSSGAMFGRVGCAARQVVQDMGAHAFGGRRCLCCQRQNASAGS